MHHFFWVGGSNDNNIFYYQILDVVRSFGVFVAKSFFRMFFVRTHVTSLRNGKFKLGIRLGPEHLHAEKVKEEFSQSPDIFFLIFALDHRLLTGGT